MRNQLRYRVCLISSPVGHIAVWNKIDEPSRSQQSRRRSRVASIQRASRPRHGQDGQLRYIGAFGGCRDWVNFPSGGRYLGRFDDRGSFGWRNARAPRKSTTRFHQIRMKPRYIRTLGRQACRRRMPLSRAARPAPPTLFSSLAPNAWQNSAPWEGGTRSRGC